MDNPKLHNGSQPTSTPGLPPDAEARVILEARKEGVFAGLTSGLASGTLILIVLVAAALAWFCVYLPDPAVIGSRLFGFKRNVSFFCGALSGVLAGYFFTKAFKDTALAQLRAEEARLQNNPRNSAEPQPPVQPRSDLT